jgi:predicted Zn-dependent peptidase
MSLPILGNPHNISGFKRDFVDKFYREKYTPGNIVISVAGGLQFTDVCRKIEEKFAAFSSDSPRHLNSEKCIMGSGIFVEENRNLEQIYSIIGLETVNADSDRKYLSLVLNEILGSGMSSRLFRTIREEKGLAYSIGSHIDRTKSAGLLMINSIIIREKIYEYLESVRDVLEVFRDKGICCEELERTKDSLKASVILGMENSLSRMRFNLGGELYENSYSIDRAVELIDSLRAEEINREIKKTIRPDEVFITLYGDLKKAEFSGYKF